MRKDLGRGSGGAGRPGWKGRAGHRRGSGPLAGGPPGQVPAAGAAGLRASRGAGSSQCRQRTAQSPPPSASPRILVEGAAAGPGLRLPRQTRLPVGPWWLVALQRQGSPALLDRAGRGLGTRTRRAPGRGASGARGAGTGAGAGARLGHVCRRRGEGGGGARGFKKVWRGRALSQARPRGVAHTQAAALWGGGHRSPRPWLRPRAPVSLLRPKVTSGAAVSRQLPPAGSVARSRSARARGRLAFPARGSKTEWESARGARRHGARRHGAQLLGAADPGPGHAAAGDIEGARGHRLLPALLALLFPVHPPRGAGRGWGAGRGAHFPAHCGQPHLLRTGTGIPW